MSLATTLALSLKAVQQLANDNFSTPVDSASFPYTGESWASGTGASQADVLYRARRTLAGTTSENLDMTGALTDKFGATITQARVKLMAFYNRAAIGSGFNLLIGGGATPFINWVNDPTDIIVLRPGGIFLLTAPDATGFAVTAATGDLLKVNNTNGSAVTYDVMIVGASA